MIVCRRRCAFTLDVGLQPARLVDAVVLKRARTPILHATLLCFFLLFGGVYLFAVVCVFILFLYMTVSL